MNQQYEFAQQVVAELEMTFEGEPVAADELLDALACAGFSLVPGGKDASDAYLQLCGYEANK